MSDQSNEQRFPEAENSNQAPSNDGGDYEVVVKLMKENEELKDRALRVAAEMENLRRRTTRDVHDARSYAIANFAREMLSVSDNLRRALDAVSDEARATADAGFKALIEGVDITERAMLASLERHGVKKLYPEGEKFDPNFHQAMFEVANADVPANTVVQVVQPGYSIGERVLRPAMVGVAKGGPKAAPAEGAAPNGRNEASAEPGPVNEQAEKDA
jgi:molecular chaperone GrpE